jgi:hypothetical protein
MSLSAVTRFTGDLVSDLSADWRPADNACLLSLGPKLLVHAITWIRATGLDKSELVSLMVLLGLFLVFAAIHDDAALIQTIFPMFDKD